MPKSEAEHQAMLQAKPQDVGVVYVWLGIDDIFNEGEWVYNDGMMLSWARWQAGNPDNWNNSGIYPDGEDCLMLSFFGSYEWNDAPCIYNHSFICQGYAGMYMQYVWGYKYTSNIEKDKKKHNSEMQRKPQREK